MKLRILIFILLALPIIGYGGWYFLFRPNDPMDGQKADFRVLAHEWVEEFKINEQAANQKYLGRIVEAKGIVREVLRDSSGGMNVILETGDAFMGVIVRWVMNEKNVKEWKVCKWMKGMLMNERYANEWKAW